MLITIENKASVMVVACVKTFWFMVKERSTKGCIKNVFAIIRQPNANRQIALRIISVNSGCFLYVCSPVI